MARAEYWWRIVVIPKKTPYVVGWEKRHGKKLKSEETRILSGPHGMKAEAVSHVRKAYPWAKIVSIRREERRK